MEICASLAALIEAGNFLHQEFWWILYSNPVKMGACLTKGTELKDLPGVSDLQNYKNKLYGAGIWGIHSLTHKEVLSPSRRQDNLYHLLSRLQNESIPYPKCLESKGFQISEFFRFRNIYMDFTSGAYLIPNLKNFLNANMILKMFWILEHFR